MQTQPDERIKRAKLSLFGLNIGDCFGETFFFGYASFKDKAASIEELIAKRELAEGDWFWTDDSQMAFSVFSTLKKFGVIDQNFLAQSFADRYEGKRGYGSGMHELMRRFRGGENWHEAAPSLFGGTGSFGNGSAMRVAPVGAYFADDLQRVCEEAEKSVVVTHTHEEAIVGAVAIAVATALAWKFRQENLHPNRAEFTDAVLPFLAKSEVKSKITRARDLNPAISTQHAADLLGNGSQISCPDTVPFCLFCAGEFLNNFEEAMWQTVSALGDRDTTCAIVGGIVVMFASIETVPKLWIEKSELMPSWVLLDCVSER